MSTKSRLAIVASLLLGSIAFAEPKVNVELVLDPPGPYEGGEQVTLHVWLRSLVTCDVTLEIVQFDFRASDPAIALDAAFQFDFSSILDNDPNRYLEFTLPELPVPFTANLVDCFCPFFFMILPENTPLHVGSVGFTVPLAPGHYEIDVLNGLVPGSTATREGSAVRAGPAVFECPDLGAMWTAFDGELLDGRVFVSVPPPIPATSTWAVLCMAVALGLIGARLANRSKRTRPP